MAEHDWQAKMQTMINAPDIDAIEAIDILGCRIEDITHMGDAGVVYECIEAGKTGKGHTNGFGIRDIDLAEGSRAAGPANKVEGFFSAFRRKVENSNIESLRGHCNGGGAPNAGASSGDDDNRVFSGLGHGMR